MRLAVLADIHGNAPAFRAVLRDMDVLGLSEAVVLGDHVSGPLDAAGTAAVLMERGFPAIRGNHDRYLIEQSPAEMGPSDAVAHAQLSLAQLDWLAERPPVLWIGDGVFCCHGTPTDDSRYWLERVDPDGRVRAATLEEVEREAEGLSADLILCAHSHIPRVLRLTDGRVIVNPGSIGCPAYDDDEPIYHRMQTGTPNASYAIVDGSPGAWSVTTRSVPYPTAEASALARQHGREDWARALTTGWL
ncbi:metallophosphatase family protein [Jannaschia sp.]|nr:metallophosphatase family protein [Jannaschia sp.]